MRTQRKLDLNNKTHFRAVVSFYVGGNMVWEKYCKSFKERRKCFEDFAKICFLPYEINIEIILFPERKKTQLTIPIMAL